MAGGGVPEHLAATFRKHYARALADAAAGGWPRGGQNVLVVAVRDGRLEALTASAGEALYVPDQHAPLKQSLVELAGHPVLVADPDSGAAIAAGLVEHGVTAVRLSDVDVRVFSGDQEVLPEPGRPLPAEGREWLVIVVALVLELKSGTFVRRAERTLRALLAQVRTVRIARLPDVAVRIGESQSVPPGSVRRVPLPDPDNPTIAVWDAEGHWDDFQACAPALAHLLAQPYLHDALQLALIKLERLVEDPGAALDDETLGRVLDTTPARVRELRRGLEGDLDGLERAARPVVAALAGGGAAERDAAYDAVRACASDAALAAVLAPYETALGMPTADALALMRRAGSMEEVRDGLGIGFAAFNHALVALGPPYAPLTHPDLHEAAVARYVAEHGDRMLERLRERYRPLAQQGQDISEHGRARRFDDLAADPAWLLTCRTPDDERLAQAGRHGSSGTARALTSPPRPSCRRSSRCGRAPPNGFTRSWTARRPCSAPGVASTAPRCPGLGDAPPRGAVRTRTVRRPRPDRPAGPVAARNSCRGSGLARRHAARRGRRAARAYRPGARRRRGRTGRRQARQAGPDELTSAARNCRSAWTTSRRSPRRPWPRRAGVSVPAR